MPDKIFRAGIFSLSVKRIVNKELQDRSSALFGRAIRRARALAIPEREINKKNRYLEAHGRRGTCIVLDFTTRNYSGPGRGNKGHPAIPMGLSSGEQYAHHTAVLYDPKEALVLIELGRPGMNAGNVAHFFQEFSPKDIQFILNPVMDSQAQARAMLHKEFRSVTLQVAVSGPSTPADRQAGLALASTFARELGGGVMNIEIKASRQKSLTREHVQALITKVVSPKTRSPIIGMKTKGREHDDDPLELIDLLQSREIRSKMLSINETERTVPRDTRWDALEEIRDEFVLDDD